MMGKKWSEAESSTNNQNMPPLETTQIPPPCDTLPKDLHALIHFCPQLITAVLDFRETPCIRTANACIEAL